MMTASKSSPGKKVSWLIQIVWNRSDPGLKEDRDNT